MKYIKYFESSNFYTLKSDIDSPVKPFSNEECESIISMFNIPGKTLGNMGPSHYGIILQDKTWEACIKLYQSHDEWYYAVISDIEDHPNEQRLYSRFRVINSKVFKCDQWDGLIECIKKEFLTK